jgi:hypothetical protein
MTRTWYSLRIFPFVLVAMSCEPPAAATVGPREDPGPTAALASLAATMPSAPILVGAGDIARCYEGENPLAATPPALSAAESTAKILDRIPGTVFAAGDNAYEFGSPLDYATCYAPTWGRHRGRTRPALGNHEYLTPGAAGYFGYFAERSAPPLGYYSYDISSWHIVVLNSTVQWGLCQPPNPLDPPSSAAEGRACAPDAAQQAWLRADLASHPAQCTLAYFHHPRFSSGLHGNQYEMQQFWDILYAAGVDVVISGHDHDYERFAPQDPDGNADPARGIREFVVGTGGAEFYAFRDAVPNSEVRGEYTHGVIAIALGRSGYAWAYIPTASGGFTDRGAARCH